MIPIRIQFEHTESGVTFSTTKQTTMADNVCSPPPSQNIGHCSIIRLILSGQRHSWPISFTFNRPLRCGCDNRLLEESAAQVVVVECWPHGQPPDHRARVADVEAHQRCVCGRKRDVMGTRKPTTTIIIIVLLLLLLWI